MTAAHTGSGRLPRGIAASAPTDADQAVIARLQDFDLERLRREFIEQGAFIYLRDFLGPQITAQLAAAVEALTASVNRNYLPGPVQIPPGGLVFFDGDKLYHRITPLAAGEKRVSLTFEYVTDPSMRPWRRFISNMKDAVAYFGFRQVFRRGGGGA